jgi:hypothetical protein
MARRANEGVFPAQPLLVAAGLERVSTGARARTSWTSRGDELPEQTHNRGMDYCAERLGVTRRTLTRWAHTGVPVLQADRCAGALGKHPSEVWGALWYELSDPSARRADAS